MKSNRFLIMGGYGSVGRSLTRLLLKETQVEVIIAGRRKEKTDEFATALCQEFPGNRAFNRCVDASDQASLIEAFQGVQLVIVLTTTPNFVKQIGQAALVSECDYLDILVSESTYRDLDELASSIRQQKRIFITQAGFHPGLPAVFVRYGAQYFDKYEKAKIGMAMNAQNKPLKLYRWYRNSRRISLRQGLGKKLPTKMPSPWKWETDSARCSSFQSK